ncbi:MAG: DUF1877 family protein [Myxococcaceae bacterium]|nr:MAG: DUF1877 family protein [Myxococcaceae bacterium]
MGLHGRLFLVPAALVLRLVREPALVDVVLFEEPDADSLARQLTLWPEETIDLTDIVRLEIDRTWHVLHFLLTGSGDEAGHPLSFLAAGGRAVSDDLGNGPLRAFTPEDVSRLAAALAQVTSEQLLERFDPRRLESESIYGWFNGWHEASRDACAPLLREVLGQLQVFLRQGAGRGRALLVVAL